MKYLMSVAAAASMFAAVNANALDVKELSYQKTAADITWNGVFAMSDLRRYSIDLNGFKYKDMYEVGSLQAGYEVGMNAAPYVSMFQAGFASSMGAMYSRNMNVRINLSLGLEYVSVSDLIPQGDSINVYSNIGPSFSVPVDGGRAGLSFETYFSHLDGARTFSGGMITVFINNEF